MSERKISYLNRTFEDYQDSLKEMIKNYYPDIANDFDDASIGSWMIDLAAAIADNLSYHIDSVYTETNVETAQQSSSMLSIAKSNGLKIPGPTGSMAEVKFTLNYVPTAVGDGGDSMPNFYYMPIIKKGTKLRANNGQYFELDEDIDFSEQFNDSGVSNRTITPYSDTTGTISKYVVSKTGIAVAGQRQVMNQYIETDAVKPFYEIILPYTDIINIESIILKTGGRYSDVPTINEFMQQVEFKAGTDENNPDIYRFFEVDNLLEQYRWGDDISTNVEGNQDTDKPKTYSYGYLVDGKQYAPVYSITKGKWIPLTQKFTTEYMDNGYMKITFGAGELANHNLNRIGDASDFSKNQISKMIRNNSLGKTLVPDCTLFISFRRGGGYESNVAANTITTIIDLDYENKYCLNSDEQDVASTMMNSVSVTNTTPSVAGKDMPTVDEIRHMIKYNNSEQKRCITVKDYEQRVYMMPSRYGVPFRVGAVEENNKVMLYMLGLDSEGQLSDVLPTVMTDNVQNYLSMYRSINDYVEIKSGRIINISFEISLFVDKNYNSKYVIKQIIEAIKEYMDINKHYLGEDIYVGDIEKEISKIDGVLNLINLSVYNLYGDGYSSTITSQTTKNQTSEEDKVEIDLEESDYILYSDADEMFEIKNPEADIKVSVKLR